SPSPALQDRGGLTQQRNQHPGCPTATGQSFDQPRTLGQRLESTAASISSATRTAWFTNSSPSM
ncbi:MAG TPA: hypothetical protein H9836_18790, partial [Candidatus Nocardiopsis merdipullorum]|nr:hypothetical protein [Candidatus Nocardiopsis merdipullorum]